MMFSHARANINIKRHIMLIIIITIIYILKYKIVYNIEIEKKVKNKKI